jgi:hypothetical protein
MVWHRVGRPYIGFYTNGGNGLTLHWTNMGVIFFSTRDYWIGPNVAVACHHITEGELFAIGLGTVLRYQLEKAASKFITTKVGV